MESWLELCSLQFFYVTVASMGTGPERTLCFVYVQTPIGYTCDVPIFYFTCGGDASIKQRYGHALIVWYS